MPAKPCTTPGCPQKAYHLGPCGKVLLPDSKRQRQACTLYAPSVDAVYANGVDSYTDSPVKKSHHELVRAIVDSGLHRDGEAKPILYLDCLGAGCTQYLLAHGIPKSRLVPCNNDYAKAQAIERFTGVACVCDDIFAVARAASEGEYALVWYDMTGTDVPIMDVAHASEHVMITVNTRGDAADVKERDMVNTVKSLPSASVLTYGVYRGTGNRLNMAFVCFRQESPARHNGVPREGRMQGYDAAQLVPIGNSPHEWIGVPLLVPLTRWTSVGLHVDDALYRITNGCVHATVVDFKADVLMLKYQTTGGGMMADQRTYEARMPRVTVDLARNWMLPGGDGGGVQTLPKKRSTGRNLLQRQLEESGRKAGLGVFAGVGKQRKRKREMTYPCLCGMA